MNLISPLSTGIGPLRLGGVPLDAGGFGSHHPPWGAGPPPFVSFLGVLMCVLVLFAIAAAIFFVRKSGGFGRGPWTGWREGPEAEAKQVLAERFANGDISSDEFMERASVLNWTPGAEPPSHGKRR